MENLSSKKWWMASLNRCIRTVAQTMIAMIPVGISINEVSWLTVIGTSLLAGILSLLTSIAGLPEVEESE